MERTDIPQEAHSHAGGAAGRPSGNDEISLGDLVRFFRRHRLLICGTAVAAAVAAALVVFFVLPRQYEASATLVVVPPAFVSELKPPTLTVQGYQKLLEADAVIDEAKTRLVAGGVMGGDDRLRLGDELETRIFVSRRADEAVLAPMIEAIARAPDPEGAAAIANTWAEVFLEKARALVAGTTSATVRFIEVQYPEARSRLIALEEQRLAAADELEQRLAEAADRWDERVLAFGNESERLLADFQAQTRRVLDEFRTAHNLETRQQQIAAMRETYSELQSEEGRIHAQLQRTRLEHEAAQRQLAETPQYFELQKAMTDEALWQLLAVQDGRGGRGGIDWSVLQGRSLLSQELNPVFLDMTRRASELEMEVNALAPRRDQLRQGLAELSEGLAGLERDVGRLESDLEELILDRRAGFNQLLQRREAGLNMLERQARNELEGIERQRETRLAQLDRDIEQQSEFHASLAQSYNQANLAEAQQDFEDVRLGAGAVPPDRPRDRRAALILLASLIFGGVLGVVWAGLLEAGS